MRRLWPFVGLMTLLVTIMASVYLASTPASEAQEVTKHPVVVEQIAPIAKSELAAVKAPRLSASELKVLRLRKLELQERLDSLVDNNPPSPPGLSLVRGRETRVVGTEAEFNGTPSAFHIGRNNFNPQAADPNLGDDLAEPVAANDGIHVFYMDNTQAEFSTDGGFTYTDVPISVGPADALFACCDPDVIHDDARRVIFWSVLYVNPELTNGVVRIFVRRNIPLEDNCAYDIDPAGTANNILPDYPHLGISNNHLHLTTNNIDTKGTSSPADDRWAGSQVRRFNIDEMAACEPTTVSTFTRTGAPGQRIFVPVEGARETMYWGMLESTTTFRIYRWRQDQAFPTSVLRIIAASTFANPDCRGGVNNLDWIERSTAWSITGFRLRGVVGGGLVAFFWNVGPDSEHTQGHVHAAVFSEQNFRLLAQPHIFNNSFCFGYPAVSANKRGNLGISIAAGGRRGGGGPPVQGFVGIDDDFTPGIGNFVTVFLTASGTHNPANQRYGDYFTVHPYEPCDKYFNATNYALNGGTGVANVNARYIEFGRQRDMNCYLAFSDYEPSH